jgi:hypothetical protein
MALSPQDNLLFKFTNNFFKFRNKHNPQALNLLSGGANLLKTQRGVYYEPHPPVYALIEGSIFQN